jgi:hypothetical protein
MGALSLTPQPGMQGFLNTGFGNRCVICGSFFGITSGVCPNGHRAGDFFYAKPGFTPEAGKKKTAHGTKFLCAEFNGKCTICGTYFEDDVCDNKHHIGEYY